MTDKHIDAAETATKKETILKLYSDGVRDIEKIAAETGSKPSYVASVLQKEGHIDHYFDLYTSTANHMNVYSKYYVGKLGFKDLATAERSVGVLDHAYRNFEYKQDRAGQHHALEMALTMLDRARWTNKLEEAEVYRQWLVGKLSRPLAYTPRPVALPFGEAPVEQEDETTMTGPEIKIAA